MRLKLFVLIVAVFLGFEGFSQFGLHYTQGYVFGNNVPVYGGRIYLYETTSQEITGLMRIGRDNAVGFSYTWQNMDAKEEYFDGIGNGSTELTWHYYQLNFQRYYRHVGSKFEPYAAGKVGLVFIDNKAPRERDFTYFTFGVDLGCRFYLTDKFGLSAAAQLMMPVQGVGGAIFVGSGGAGVGVNGYSSIAQFCLNIGGFIQL